MRLQAPTHQFLGLLERPLSPADGGFPWLSSRLFDLLYLLAKVGLHQLQFGFVAAEALGTSVGVDEVGHGCGTALFTRGRYENRRVRMRSFMGKERRGGCACACVCE